MQPPKAEESKDDALNSSTNITFKRPRAVKKENVSAKQPLEQEFDKSIETVDTTAKDEIATVTSTSSPVALETTRKYRGKCLYQSRKCENERAVKRNGKPHNLCEAHRSKQNQHQRKFDAKKFSVKRLHSIYVEDSQCDDVNSRQDDGRTVKYHRVNDGADTGISSMMVNSHMTPIRTAMREKYSLTYTAGSTPMSLSMTRLPPSDSLRESILPPTSALNRRESQCSAPEACPSSHVRYSDYRHGAGHVGLNGHKPFRDNNISNLQPHVVRPSHGYSHSELVAASILLQSQPSAPPRLSSNYQPVASSSSLEAEATPRLLPSLLVPSLGAFSQNPHHRSSRMLASSSQHFTSVTVNSTPSISVPPRKVLPPLVPSGRRKSSTSPPPVSSLPKSSN